MSIAEQCWYCGESDPIPDPDVNLVWEVEHFEDGWYHWPCRQERGFAAMAKKLRS